MGTTLFQTPRPLGLPTETVYGLAAPVNREDILREVFRLKERPFFDPLIVHVSSVAMACDYTHPWPPVARDLAQHFWPGPLTLVLPKKDNIPDLITAGNPTVAMRMPDHPLALRTIEEWGTPLAAPSANKFSCTSPTHPDHVREIFGDSVTVLDGGPCPVGIESTIVRPLPDRLEILRPGAIGTREMVEVVGDIPMETVASGMPGQFPKHYAPGYPLVTALRSLGTGELDSLRENLGIEGFERRHIEGEAVLAARHLYGLLRKPVTTESYGVFLRVCPRANGLSLWEAIFDRLKRASVFFLD